MDASKSDSLFNSNVDEDISVEHSDNFAAPAAKASGQPRFSFDEDALDKELADDVPPNHRGGKPGDALEARPATPQQRTSRPASTSGTAPPSSEVAPVRTSAPALAGEMSGGGRMSRQASVARMESASTTPRSQLQDNSPTVLSDSRSQTKATSIDPTTPPAKELNSSLRSARGGLSGDSDDLLKSSLSMHDRHAAPPINELNSSMRSNKSGGGMRAVSGGASPMTTAAATLNELTSTMRSSRSVSLTPAPLNELSSSMRSVRNSDGGNSRDAAGLSNSGDLLKSSLPKGAFPPPQLQTPPTGPTSAAGSRPGTSALPFSASTPTVPVSSTTNAPAWAMDVDMKSAPNGTKGAGKGGPPASWAAVKVAQGRLQEDEKPAAPMVYDQSAVDALGYKETRFGLEVPGPLQLFLQYDQDRCGGIKQWEFKQMLEDLDGLAEVDPKAVDRYVAAEFDRADQSNQGVVCLDEFYVYYYSTLCFKFPVLRTGVNPGADLFNIFVKFASAGDNTRNEEMGCHQFSRMVRACKLIDGKRVTKAGVDIIYWRARAADETLEDFVPKPGVFCTAKMFYPQFLFAMQHLAHKRRTGFMEVVSTILANVSATPAATLSDFLLMRATGDPAEEVEHLLRPRGLPPAPRIVNSNIDRLRQEALLARELMRGRKAERKAAEESDDVAGAGPLMSTQQRRAWGFGESSNELSKKGAAALNDPKIMHQVRSMDPDTLMVGLKRAFEAYNKSNAGLKKSAMDKIKWSRCLTDARLISAVQSCNPGLPLKSAELIFARMLSVAKYHINFIEFIEALRHVACGLRLSINEVMHQIVAFGGPCAGL